MRDQIYCSGSLLAAVQSARIFGDCKHFVDMPLKGDAETVLAAWNQLLSTSVENGKIDAQALNNFIQEHFEQPGGELEEYHPEDFNAEEQFASIADPHYRSWAQELHRKWPTLCRRVADKVLTAPDRYSLIALPKPFVVPGGRFREMYYWDSFFTIKGLIASGMFGTVRGMIENMGHLIDQYGFVPNGNRIYYLNRSQPPLLAWCLNAYYQKTGDVEFIRVAMPWLEREMEFFTQNKKYHRDGWSHHLFRYHVKSEGPRPESYREDMESAEHIEDAIEKCRLWGDIAAAAESGRDFSSRWFQNDPTLDTVAGKMGSTRTSSLIPVDLNAIICGNLRIISEFYGALGEEHRAMKALAGYEAMRETIRMVLWSEEAGCWFDFDISNNRHVDVYHDTNFFPLFTDCTHEGFDGSRIVEYLTKMGVLGYPGGVPSSLISSGQQWDFPNAWAPTTWVIIQGLRTCGQTELARIIAEKWIQKNYVMWKQTGGRMFEKYNVASSCFKAGVGGGGEYEVQEGFGWTNGVVLDLLTTYQSELNWNADLLSHAKGGSFFTCECCQPAEAILRSRKCSMSATDAPLGIVDSMFRSRKCSMSAADTPLGMDSMFRSRKCSMSAAEAPIGVVDSILSGDPQLLDAIPESNVEALMGRLAALAADNDMMAERGMGDNRGDSVVDSIISADLRLNDLHEGVGSRVASRKISLDTHSALSPLMMAEEIMASAAGGNGPTTVPDMESTSTETLVAVAEMMAQMGAAAQAVASSFQQPTTGEGGVQAAFCPSAGQPMVEIQ